MLTDRENDLVYISDRLEPAFPALVDRLRRILDEHGIALKELQGTRDVWCRDYMPVQVAEGEFVRFDYAPSYLRGYKHLITDVDRLAPIPEIERCRPSEIVIDGGNVVRWGSRCIVTDRIFRENPGLDRTQLIQTLRDLVRVQDLIVIPTEPGDEVGHADGVARFIDDETVVINDYEVIDRAYRRRLLAVLQRAGLRWVELPYRPKDGRKGEIPPAFGNYVNSIRVRDLVILPGYGIPEDRIARRILVSRLPGTEVVTLNCASLSMEGGALRCVTWNVAG